MRLDNFSATGVIPERSRGSLKTSAVPRGMFILVMDPFGLHQNLDVMVEAKNSAHVFSREYRDFNSNGVSS